MNVELSKGGSNGSVSISSTVGVSGSLGSSPKAGLSATAEQVVARASDQGVTGPEKATGETTNSFGGSISASNSSDGRISIGAEAPVDILTPCPVASFEVGTTKDGVVALGDAYSNVKLSLIHI